MVMGMVGMNMRNWRAAFDMIAYSVCCCEIFRGGLLEEFGGVCFKDFDCGF